MASNLWSSHFSRAGDSPIFVALDLETPLALASFLACNINLHKVFVPASFNMNKILNDIKL